MFRKTKVRWRYFEWCLSIYVTSASSIIFRKPTFSNCSLDYFHLMNLVAVHHSYFGKQSSLIVFSNRWHVVLMFFEGKADHPLCLNRISRIDLLDRSSVLFRWCWWEYSSLAELGQVQLWRSGCNTFISQVVYLKSSALSFVISFILLFFFFLSHLFCVVPALFFLPHVFCFVPASFFRSHLSCVVPCPFYLMCFASFPPYSPYLIYSASLPPYPFYLMCFAPFPPYPFDHIFFVSSPPYPFYLMHFASFSAPRLAQQ